MKKGVTYKQAGVDIDKANEFVNGIRTLIGSTNRREVIGAVGGFGGCFSLKGMRHKHPVLVSSTDGVGTKLKIAMIAGVHDTVGIDLVAMNVNDILTLGAEPLFFLDYIATGKVDPQALTLIVKGIAEGCRQSGCALIGGETAEMPVLYKHDEYDLAGFCVGIVDKKSMITGAAIRPGDVLVGMASSGLHSNGFSMVHAVFTKAEIKKHAAELLEPTRIYVRPVLSLIERVAVHGLAHITGGAFYEKLMRIFPATCDVTVRKNSWQVPDIFTRIQRAGKVADHEMYRTFNMGIGMVAVVSPRDVAAVMTHMRRHKIRCWEIGSVRAGTGTLHFQED